MNRLTYKLDDPIKTKYLNYEYKRISDYDIDRCNFGRITDDMIFNKLGKLEDIEEELGIDLIILFKALRKGIYVKQYGQIEHYFLKLLSDGINLYLTNYGGTRVILSQDYYGKTWALSEKELEND